MKSVIVFRGGRSVNLADDISAELYEELEATQGKSHRTDPLLRCGQCNGGVYIKHLPHKDELHFSHFPGGDCPATLIARKTAPMTEEHRRLRDYIPRSAEAQGLDGDIEVRTTGRTIIDAVVRDGTNAVGFEVQRQHVSVAEAKGRTERSVASGAVGLVAWASTPSGVNPGWLGRVPGYRIPDQAALFKPIPDLRSVRAYGVADVDAVRSWRGTWEPELRLLRPLVDAVVADLVTGKLRAVLYGGQVRLMTASGITRWQEITGYALPDWNPERPVMRSLPPAAEVKCDRPAATWRPHSCQIPGCEDPSRPYGIGWYCTGHRWQIELTRRKA